MRTPFKSLAKAALTRPLSILFILLIGTIGVQTITSCSGDDNDGVDPPIVSNCSLNGGTVAIDSQVWMAENLNCNVSGSKCYNNDPANCAKYGRLYDWETAIRACPTGWHLPSDAEWAALVTAVGGYYSAEKLKATSGWEQNGNGTDDFGFSALPGGDCNSSGDFYYVGNIGRWWSSSDDRAFAISRSLESSEAGVIRGNNYKGQLFSVRCLQD